MTIEAPRGTLDVLPAEQPLRDLIVGTAEALAALYGYGRIVTPVFEDTELFARTSGAGSDVVQKEMYTFEDRSGRSLTLRPEGTAPVARAYLEHGLHREPQPVKTFYVAPMYRYAAPQKGRYREFWQIGVEAMGSDDPALDAEQIQLFAELERRLGIEGTRLELNSIGDRACRPAYVEALTEFLAAHDAELDEDARAKARTSPLRVFDSKNPAVQEVLAEAPTIGESLCDACREHFEAVRAYLSACGRRLRGEPDARARARLLHAHRVGVRARRARRRAEHDLRRRTVRRPDRGDRRRADPGRGVGRRDRADRHGRGRGARAGARRRVRRLRRVASTGPRSSPRSRSSAAPA